MRGETKIKIGIALCVCVYTVCRPMCDEDTIGRHSLGKHLADILGEQHSVDTRGALDGIGGAVDP